MFRRPLKLHLCWSPRDTATVRDLARAVYSFVSRSPTDDPVLRPGVGVPTEVGRDLVDLVDRLAHENEPGVDQRVVVPLLAADGYSDAAFRGALARILALGAAGSDVVVLPVVLDPRWHASLSADGGDQVRSIDWDRASSASDPDRLWRLGCDVAISVGRVLRGSGEPASPPHVFLSHARADLESSDRLALQLRDRLASDTDIRVDLHEHAGHPGRWLRDELRAAGSAAVLLVVRTDSYSDDPWCAEDLVLAKTAHVPIVTVLCTSQGESRAAVYGGNHRTVHWQPGRQWEVIGRCVQAWLHHRHFAVFGRAVLGLAGLPTDSVLLSRRPELLDLGATRGLVVYPDPPMPEAERDVLRANRPDVRLATPNTLFGRVLMDRDTAPPLSGVTLAFSLSDDSRLRPLESVEIGSGITRTHHREALDAIILSTIHSGARISYGGDLRRGGFSEKLSELVLAHRRLGLGGRPQLLCHLDGGVREGDGTVVFEPIEIAAPVGTDRIADKGVRDSLWHHAMRRTSSRDCSARVLLGGKTRPRGDDEPDGYRGPWPGILEEAFRTVQAGRALFIVGAFEGCTGDIAQMLRTGEVPETLRHTGHAGKGDFDATVAASDDARTALAAIDGADRDLLLLGADGPLRMDAMAEALLQEWTRFVAGGASLWSNGLTVDENHTLFATTDTAEITHLVFAGLTRLQAGTAPRTAARLRCYYGDIASITGVDAYAVTISPGMEPVGASAALDARCGGRLRRVVAARGIEVVGVAGNALAGRHVVVATLDLPAASAALDPRVVTALAERVGGECRRLGLGSIACPVFGATLGLDVATSVHAMLQGFAAAGAPATITFCEIDAHRIEQLRAALPTGAFEDLREGPLPPVAPKRAVLYLAAHAPDASGPGRIEANLYHDDLGAAVPCGTSDPIDAQTWERLRARCETMAEVDACGDALLRRLLPDKVCRELQAHPDVMLAIVLDQVASGLPWEAMHSPTRAWTPAITVPFARRIALVDAESTLPPPSRRSARRRFLIVSDPTGDLDGARDETRAIAELLRTRPDVDLVTIAGPLATRARVEQALSDETWDIFHYAGHAFFDPSAAGRSGLVLADGALLASDLVRVRVPRLVVLGACESARVRGPSDHDEDPRAARWSFAEGVLRRGVRSFLGTFFVVDDAAAQDFSVKLYQGLLAGHALGLAVRDARALLHRRAQPDWANFLLYGDGTLTL